MALNKKERASIAVFVFLIAGVFAYGRGVGGASAPSFELADDSSATTSSTVIGLQGRDFKRGQCITWDQSTDRSYADRSVYVVDCNDEHLAEFVSTEKPKDLLADYPNEAEMDQLIQSLCAGPAKDYLGYELNPAGRFYVSAIIPQEESWRSGSRDFSCTLQANSLANEVAEGLLLPFTGPVKGSGQELLYPVGVCLSDAGVKPDVVDCNQPWSFAVTGNVEVEADLRPSSNDQWAALVQDQCMALSKASRPESFNEDLVGWYFIEQSSWDAGSRTVQCVLYEDKA